MFVTPRPGFEERIPGQGLILTWTGPGELPRADSASPARSSASKESSRTQRQLQLHGIGLPYELTEACKVPALQHKDEVLIEVKAISLNPIDWKSADYGFGIPTLPCIKGCEYAGKVVALGCGSDCHGLRIGDSVIAITTDYRDYRKAAFQEFAVAWQHNVCKVPSAIDPLSAASVGVAFIAASFALGISLGITFPSLAEEGQSLDMLSLARSQPIEHIPFNVRNEVLYSLDSGDRPSIGEWILIMDASSVSGQVATQLSKLSGLRVIAVADVSKYGEKLSTLGADLVLDRHNLPLAAETICDSTNGTLRLAIDTVSKETASWCQEQLLCSEERSRRRHQGRSLSSNSSDHSEASTAHRISMPSGPVCHLVGLAGLPEYGVPHVRTHNVPMKLFHENAELGKEVMQWLGAALEKAKLRFPEVEVVEGGLDVVNGALNRLREGDDEGKRLVVKMKGWPRVEEM
ncbi:GroES-like protein [Aulographum hederae CBS 113979]|uniref:GroES-like protein n=1 Tax=Aulographum hederae CBS 113979 TaxID=1176131 RepID=A0A6G1GJJ7_9PEZI|nr:GroES-like protein [Aulographum hederae CBS 113979]